ncbi:Origin recognition complex subunit 5 [Trametes pubescens]|uniref:Origin recognition complex subunit 5 n=1 Tax=Trametes pubescens TaxID=154538 RepID=A0A1M2VJJ8_TRAPU|nr:Origin recognition complex subunit 5 [Trametes pubescens]
MGEISPALRTALAASPEYELAVTHLSALLLSDPPSFIFIHDPENARLTSSVVTSALESLASQGDAPVNLTYACVNAVTCFSSRILFDTALNSLAGWTPDWDSGALNWPGTADGSRHNENFDSFVHGIQEIYTGAVAPSTGVNETGKGKGKASEHTQVTRRMVLVVDRAERLKDNLPDLLVPLTRLSELTQVDITTVFISENQWQDIRPPLRAAPEPYYIDVPLLSKQATLDIIASSFPAPSPSEATSSTAISAYHPALKPLYAGFIATLYSACGPFTHDPAELAYIAAARWPGFVQPVLDAHRRPHAAQPDEEELPDEDDDTLAPPSEDVRLRLTRLFSSSFTAALEALYPRLTHAEHWAHTHSPPDDLLAVPPAHASQALYAHTTALAAAQADTGAGLEALPRMAKFILVAAFLASTNPARSDLRMFGRGLDERTRKRRRKVGTPRKPKPGTTGTAVKIPQRLLGPTTFPLDRLIAMLGVLLEENDADVRPAAPQYTLPGEYTEMEISRVALQANIMELASMRLLVRTSPSDRLDGTPTFKCGIGFELAAKIARDLGIVLNDLMYDPL